VTIPATPPRPPPWIDSKDWEQIASDGDGCIHRTWIGHGWLLEVSTDTGSPSGLTFVPPATRGPWASPESAIDQLGDVA